MISGPGGRRLVAPVPPAANSSNHLATTDWVHSAAVMQAGGDTINGPLTMQGGLVVGTPAGGNLGVGTINCQRSNVDGPSTAVGGLVVGNPAGGNLGVGTINCQQSNVDGPSTAVGGLVVGNPAGGNMGVGSINCQELYIRGAVPGQYASRIVPSANALALTSGVTIDVISVPLPPGQWFIGGEVWVTVLSGSPNLQLIAAAISGASATIPSEPSDTSGVNLQEPQQPRTGAGTGAVLPIAGVFLNLSVQTTYYLSAQVIWTGTGTLGVFGKIAGRFYPN
jgi:hypothetical protein